MTRLAFIIPTLVIVVLIGLMGYGLTRDPSVIPSAFIGKQAPEFAVPQLHWPTQLFTQEKLQGEPSVFNVWASWCVGCRTEHPLVEELAARSGVKVYGLNYKDERENALAWLDRYGDPFDASAWDYKGEVGFEWGVGAVPETFIVDRDGFIRYKQVGPIDRQTLEEKILPLLSRLLEEGQQ